MPFEEVVYRGFGPHQRNGGGFSTLGVNSEEELAKALADGWFRTLPEAIEAHDNPKAVGEVPADDAPPTRQEMEQKAKELGLKFDGRTSDRKLGDLIAKALG